MTYMSSPPFPDLTADGLLPYDIHLTLDELAVCPLVTGEGLAIRRWDPVRRQRLTDGLRFVVQSLWDAGFTGEIGVNGSFAEAALRPRDVDVYCILSDDEVLVLQERLDWLNARDGEHVWTCSNEDRVHVPGCAHPVSPLWQKYRVDLHFDFGQFAGILGPNQERLRVRDVFRQDREFFRAKGVICLVPPGAARTPHAK